MGSGVLWKTIVTYQSLLVHPEMPQESLLPLFQCRDAGQFSGPELILDDPKHS